MDVAQDTAPPSRRRLRDAWRSGRRPWDVHPALACTWAGIVVFWIVFGRLGQLHHRNYGTWSFDMAIYDQSFWQMARGGTFTTVRGLPIWGHHVNLVGYLYVPFYWLGVAGPTFLMVTQAIVLGLAGLPTYLLARDRFRSEWIGLAFAIAVLGYAPIQFISWANFHPEALVITPLLFAWWCASRRAWTGFTVALLLALSTREDTALAVTMMGVVLAGISYARRSSTRRSLWRAGWATFALGAVWYLVTTRLVMRHFNYGMDPYYVAMFYGEWGTSMSQVIGAMVTDPVRVIRTALLRDRLDFYWKLLSPLGGLPLLGFPLLLMAAPQMVASVTGATPYAREIYYQYPSVMIAPIVIAAVEGTAFIVRRVRWRQVAAVWLAGSTLVSNVVLSPSPIGRNHFFWVTSNERRPLMDRAVAMVPPEASVSATYTFLPHLAHRDQAFDWPNPFRPVMWGNEVLDEDGYPVRWIPSQADPAGVEYLVLLEEHIGDEFIPMVSRLIGSGGEFRVLLDEDGVIVARRNPTGQPGAGNPVTAGAPPVSTASPP